MNRRDSFVHRLTCSKQLSLRLAAELLGDNCACEEDANKSVSRRGYLSWSLKRTSNPPAVEHVFRSAVAASCLPRAIATGRHFRQHVTARLSIRRRRTPQHRVRTTASLLELPGKPSATSGSVSYKVLRTVMPGSGRRGEGRQPRRLEGTALNLGDAS